jgi:GntR family transcriptional regulator
MPLTASPPSTRIDLNRSAVSRYIQLAGLFRHRIESGEWAVGQQIPTVDDLASECGVARATIRQSLGILESEQLIERFRAKGTFVRPRSAAQLWCEVPTTWAGLLMMSRDDAVIEILSDAAGEQPPRVPHEIGHLAPSYRHVRRRHSSQGVPFLVAELYIDERLSARISRKDLQTKTALRLISDIAGVKVADARQTLVISTADVEAAQRLDIQVNAPVALVDRSVVDRSKCLVLLASGTYRGDMVRMDIKLK